MYLFNIDETRSVTWQDVRLCLHMFAGLLSWDCTWCWGDLVMWVILVRYL